MLISGNKVIHTENLEWGTGVVVKTFPASILIRWDEREKHSINTNTFMYCGKEMKKIVKKT